LLVVLAALAWCLALPHAASATVSCSFSGDTATVTLTGGGDEVRLRRDTDGDLLVLDPDSAVTCTGGTPNMNISGSGGNLNDVVVNDASAAQVAVVLDLGGGSFAPGATLELGGSEVEITLNLDDEDDRVDVEGSDAAQTMHAGVDGSQIAINLTGGEMTKDADVLLAGLSFFRFFGRGGDDVFLADGSVTPFDTPFPVTVALIGEDGHDQLVAGSVGASLDGGAGDDVLSAVPGGDAILARPGPGDDTATGSPGGGDELSYVNSAAGVSVDLAVTGPQETGGAGRDAVSGFEILDGSGHDDVLRGRDGPVDVLHGRGGADLLEGRGGADTIHGDIGAPDNDPDTISFEGAAGGVTIDLAGTTTSGAEADHFEDIQNVVGSAHADTITGDDEANTLDGRGGQDALSAMGGSDALLIRDGVADTASCGTGTDGVTADQAGVDAIDGDCEIRDFFVPPPSPPGLPGAAPPAPSGSGPAPPRTLAPDRLVRALLGGSTRQRVLRRRALLVTVRCGAEPCTATGAATVTTSGARRRRGRAAATFRLRSARASVRANRAATLRLRLDRRAVRRVRAALRRRHRVRARVTVTVADAARNRSAATRTVTIVG
jgi:hypothetical protein